MLWGCVRASFANASHVGLYTSARRLGGLALQVLSSSPMLLIRRSSSSSSSSTSSRRVSLHPPTLPTGAVAAARRARMTPPPVSPRASHPPRHRHPRPTSQGCRARGLCRTISRCSRASKLRSWPEPASPGGFRGRSPAGTTIWGPCSHPLPRSPAEPRLRVPVVAGPGAVAARTPGSPCWCARKVPVSGLMPSRWCVGAGSAARAACLSADLGPTARWKWVDFGCRDSDALIWASPARWSCRLPCRPMPGPLDSPGIPGTAKRRSVSH